MLSKQKQLSVSFLACAVLFTIVLSLGHPIYNSGDDVYLLYLLGGGFGNAPTNLLHYNYVLHPLLGWLIKTLFNQFLNVNWYSILLYIFHFIGCTILLNILLSVKKIQEAFIIFSLSFFVFESQFLMNLTFTNTALVLAIAGIILLLHDGEDVAKSNNSKKILAIICICVSAMLRLHTLVPLLCVSLPFICFKLIQKKFRVIYSLCFAGAVAFFLNYFQQQYYLAEIPKWQSEEAYRTAFFSYANGPKKFDSLSYNTHTALLRNGLLWDKEYLSAPKIEETKSQVEALPGTQATGFKNILYWYFTNNRIYLLMLASIISIALFRFSKKNRFINLFSLSIMLSIFIYLLLFKKLPAYIIPALIFFYILLVAVFSQTEIYISGSTKKMNFLRCAELALIIAVFIWSLIRLEKKATFNKNENENFLCCYKEINANQGKLFIVTDDHFPLDYFSVLDIPKKFVLRNLLYKDHLLNNTFQPIYNRFAITNAKDFINNENIIFVGKKIPEIQDYYKSAWGLNVHFTEPDTNYRYSEARKLIY